MSKILHGDLVDIEEVKEKLSHYAFVRSDITIDDLVKQLTIILPSNSKNLQGNNYIISEKALYKLILNDLKFEALESGGVDDWVWCFDALEEFARDICNYNPEEEKESLLDAFERKATEILQYLKTIGKIINE